MNQKNIIQKLEQIKMLLEECIVELSIRQDIKPKNIKKSIGSQSKITARDLDFEIPIRPFVKRYAKRLSGSKKFVLLLAWLTKGDKKKEVSLTELKAHWKKMEGSSLLGLKFNRFFPAEAHENDWIERMGKGLYRLRPNWHNILLQRREKRN